ncbi:restriction endonuclease subunit S [Bacteroidota bacterium]
MSNIKIKGYALDDLGKLSRGRSKHRPRNAPHLYNGPYPFIQTADITNSSLFIKEYGQTYSEAGLAQSKLWNPGTLCIVNAGVNTGDNSILSFEACFPDSVIGFIPQKNKCEVRYIKYFLDSIKNSIKSITMGATQDNLSLSKLLTFKIPETPPQIQKKIAAIISAFDELIHTNNRHISYLEKIAEEIYREWFVRMRYPGSLNEKFVKGVPENWKEYRFGKLVGYYIGGGWGNEMYDIKYHKGAYVIRGTDIPDLNNGLLKQNIYRYHKQSNYDSRRLLEGDIIFEVSGGAVKTSYLVGHYL